MVICVPTDFKELLPIYTLAFSRSTLVSISVSITCLLIARPPEVWCLSSTGVPVYQCTSTTSLSYTEGDTCSSKLSYLLFPRSSTTSLKRLSLPLTFGLFLIGSLMKLVSPPWSWIVMIRYHLKHLQCFKNAGMQSVTKELKQLKVSQ